MLSLYFERDVDLTRVRLYVGKYGYITSYMSEGMLSFGCMCNVDTTFTFFRDLSYNRITMVKTNVFHGLQYLTYLYVK